MYSRGDTGCTLPFHFSVGCYTLPAPPSFWRQWQQLLQHLTTGWRLSRPLRSWIAPPLNSWLWYKDILGIVWQHGVSNDQWMTYDPMDLGRRHRTRSTVNSYRTSVPSTSAPSHSRYPATIIPLRDGYSKAIPSVSAIVNAASLSDIDLWWHAETPLPLSATPPFFQHLINTMLTDVQCQDIASELREHTLAICSDGACDTDQHLASHGEVFASSLLQ